MARRGWAGAVDRLRGLLRPRRYSPRHAVALSIAARLTAHHGITYVGLYLIATAILTLITQLLLREANAIPLDAAPGSPPETSAEAVESGSPDDAKAEPAQDGMRPPPRVPAAELSRRMDWEDPTGSKCPPLVDLTGRTALAGGSTIRRSPNG